MAKQWKLMLIRIGRLIIRAMKILNYAAHATFWSIFICVRFNYQAPNDVQYNAVGLG